MTTFYFDENLSPQIGRAVRLIVGSPGCHIKVVREQHQGIKDPELLQLIGDEGAFLITCDTKMAKRGQRELLARHGIGAFFLRQRSVLEQTTWIFRAWPAIERAVLREERPFQLKIRPGGTLESFKRR